jgi:hypothetical protein
MAVCEREGALIGARGWPLAEAAEVRKLVAEQRAAAGTPFTASLDPSGCVASPRVTSLAEAKKELARCL